MQTEIKEKDKTTEKTEYTVWKIGVY